MEYPRVPGHEIAGVIYAIGKDVIEWNTGQRLGVGWHGGHCGHRILLQLELNCLRDYLIYGQKYLLLGLVL